MSTSMYKINSIYRSESSKSKLDPIPFLLTSPESKHHIYHSFAHFCDIECKTAGQDTLLFIRNYAGSDHQLLFGVADGHGTRGHLHSYASIRVLANQFYQNHKSIVDCLVKKEDISIIINKCYEDAHKILTNKNIFPALDHESGTTISLCLILMVRGNRYLISTNAGDSPILLSQSRDTSKVIELSQDHNCDNPIAVEGYLNHLADIRDRASEQHRDKLLPRPVYYGRINCPGGIQWSMIKDAGGRPIPIPVYEYYGERLNKLRLNRESYETISKYYPHGEQSVRRPPTYTREDGRVVALPGRETENWGSTLGGKNQALRGFGDLELYPHHTFKPYVKTTLVNSKSKVIVGTDGLTDLFHYNELFDWFYNNTHLPIESFYPHIFHKASGEAQFGSRLVEGILHPCWDDLSGIVVDIGDNHEIRSTEELVKNGMGLFNQAYS